MSNHDSALTHRRKSGGQEGFLIVAIMLMITGLLLLSTVAVQRGINISHQVQRAYTDERVFNAAEGGADVAESWLRDVLVITPDPTQSSLDGFTAPALAGFLYPELTITKLPLRSNVLVRRGALEQLHADITPFEILSRATNTRVSNSKVVRLLINEEAVSLYQFGIYYNDDLEIYPDFPLDYMGRIHTNGNLYIGSHNTLDLDARVSAAGHIYNIPKDPTMNYNGKARLKDPAGQWHDLSYDSRDPDWVSKSLTDWGGNVQDSAHGMTQLPYPMPVTSDVYDIITRGVVTDTPEIRAKKYYYRAGLRILDNVAKDSAGVEITLAAGVITTSTVWDCREQRMMAMRNLDIAALTAAGQVPENRLIYISYTHSNAAVRIQNASALPTRGIVIATDNPLYVWGPYNTVNKQPSSLLCDAFNVYSGNWLDATSTQSLSLRVASATSVNTCVVAGNQTTATGDYGGGAENLIRLHEKWVGHELTYRGSLICLWTSRQAVGDFADACYVEAQRDWGFDPLLLDPVFWPKDYLSARHISRASWRPY